MTDLGEGPAECNKLNSCKKFTLTSCLGGDTHHIIVV